MKEKNLDLPFLLHGGDYNPEQWKEDKKIWDEDMRLMKKAHCNTMTIGMFSWSEIEKSEGRFDFSTFDEIIDRIDKNGGKVFLATPSGARPHWLAEKYPEVLRTDERGMKNFFGGRQNHCYTSPVYRERVRIVNEEISKRYGKHPAVIGWHISNEYGGRCYCEQCKKEFRKFVQNRYKTIEKLNHEYWATFWSHTYDSFDQVEPPRPSGEMNIHALTLDWRRFVSAQTQDFMRAEIAAVRKYSDKPVTTNMMPGFYDLDYSRFAKDLDFISWDNYPMWHAPGDRHESGSAYWYDFFRCVKNKPTILMENTPSKVNWTRVCKLKERGMNDLAAMQAIAHGSDGFLYFQWRQSRGSSEKLHGAVVDCSCREDTRVFKEVSATGEKLEALSPVITGMPVEQARVAILFDWNNMWAFEGVQGLRYDKDYRTENQLFYKTLFEKNIPCDVVDPHTDLTKYDLVVAVAQYVTDRETIGNLERYVKNGGTLYATYLLGIANENDLRYMYGTPAEELKDVFGIVTEEVDTLYEQQNRHVIVNGKAYEAEKYIESVILNGATPLGYFTDGIFENQPCMTVHAYGKGKAYYQAFANYSNGADDFKADMLGEILSSLGITSHILPYESEKQSGEVSHRVTSRMRHGKDGDYLFVFNYSESPAEAELDGEYEDFFTGEKARTIRLEKFGTRVMKRAKP